MLKHCVLVAVILLFCLRLQAQTVTGSIVGNVLDSSGAAVPNAQISVTNQETGIARTAVSTEQGFYSVPQLRSGTYTVSATAAGFEKTDIKDVTVVVDADTRVDLKLGVAGTSQIVTVTTEAPTVNTTTADVGQLMTTADISAVPLNARDIQQLAGIQTGVQFDFNNNWGNQIVVAGSRPQSNRYLEEGIDTTWSSKTSPVSAAGIVLGVEATKEFQVLTSDYGAEYGERPGGTVNVIWKSGSNGFHGSAYEYYRNSTFDARSILTPLPVPRIFTVISLAPLSADRSKGTKLSSTLTMRAFEVYWACHKLHLCQMQIPGMVSCRAAPLRRPNLLRAPVRPPRPWSPSLASYRAALSRGL